MEKFNVNEKLNILEDPQIKALYDKLYLIKRTGWVERGVNNPETVGEHTGALVDLVDKWKKDLGIKDPEKLKNMLRIHDWPEIKDGDINLARLPDQEFDKAKEEKFKNENISMQEICNTLGPKGKELFDLWVEFEKKDNPDSLVGFQLDKIQAVIKAFDYESKGEKVSTQEFIDYVERKNYITHPFLLNKISELKLKLK